MPTRNGAGPLGDLGLHAQRLAMMTLARNFLTRDASKADGLCTAGFSRRFAAMEFDH
jgi:hypothetical protein